MIKPLRSSNLAGYDYDEASKTLTVVFHSGARYDYANVEPTVADELANAASPGKYFHAHIRNRYAFRES